MKKKKQRKNKKISKFFKIFDYRIFGYEFIKVTGGLPIVIYLRLKKLYINKKIKKFLNHKPYLIAANHTGYLDIMIVANTFWRRRLRFIATKDVFNTKVKSALFTMFGCIKVDKQNVSMETFKKITDTLNRGHCVPIFPEGTIIKNDELIDYKSGVILMSFISKCPIVPMYIPKKEKWYHRQKVVIGDIFDVSKYTESKVPSMEEIKRLTVMLHDIEIDLKNKFEEGKL